jgi:hypothetical protein
MWETIAVITAAVVGALAVLLIVWRQSKSGAAGGCGGCAYGNDPSDCEPPADAPPHCPKLK